MFEIFNRESKDVQQPDAAGVRSEWYDERDWMAGSVPLEHMYIRSNFEESGFEYNQNLVSNVSCTVVSAVTAYSNNILGEEIPVSVQQDIWNKALNLEENPADPNNGWWIPKAVNLVRKELNAKYNQPNVQHVRLEIGSPYYYELLDKGFCVNTGFRVSSELREDYTEDGVVDGVSFPDTGGHAITHYKDLKTGKYKQMVVDNYTGLKQHNTYAIADLQGLIDNGVYYKYGYVYFLTKKPEMSNNNEQIQQGNFPDINDHWAEDYIKQAASEGWVSGYSDGTFKPNRNATRAEIVKMIIESRNSQ